MEKLARNPQECAARGIRSRELAEEHYDIRKQAEKTAHLYEDVIRKWSQGRGAKAA
jgi:hypothetical protein